MADLDFDAFDVLTFDCYGTLIDWEAGLLEALREPLSGHGIEAPDEAMLEAYARHEAELESGPYLPYRQVLAGALAAMLRHQGAEPGDAELASFGGSVVDWPAFPDSPAALQRLHERFRLGVITNCDDDLFAASEARLGLAFDWGCRRCGSTGAAANPASAPRRLPRQRPT